jgi:hypothetical protein
MLNSWRVASDDEVDRGAEEAHMLLQRRGDGPWGNWRELASKGAGWRTKPPPLEFGTSERTTAPQWRSEIAR